MNWLSNLWRRLTTSTETALLRAENRRLKETDLALEDENFRLRADLREATNSLLSQAGVAPLSPSNEEPPKSIARVRHLTVHQQRRLELVRGTRLALEEGKEMRERVEKKIHAG